MYSIYKSIILFILLANALAIPIKRDGSEGKTLVFEKIKTVLSCICYYEEGESLDKDNIDKYCDCTPEKVDSDKSLTDGSDPDYKAHTAKFLTNSNEEENLSDVQLYGSGDAAFFANLEENEAKIDEENEKDEKALPLFNSAGKFLAKIDDEDYVDETAMEGDFVENVQEFDSINEIPSDSNKKYVISQGLDENDNDVEVGYIENTRHVYDNDIAKADEGSTIQESEVIYDENGNPIKIEVQMLGEAYEEDADADDDNEDLEVPSRPTINRSKALTNHRKILEEFDEPLVGADARYVINYYNKDNEIDDDINDDDNIVVDEDEELDIVEEDEEDEDAEAGIIDTPAPKAIKTNNDVEAEDNDDDDDLGVDISDDDDIKSIYKKLIVKKLKADIKKMDSEKLIVDIIKEALTGGNKENSNPLKNILS